MRLVRALAEAVGIALAAIAIIAAGLLLFIVGDRGEHSSLLQKRDSAAWAVVRGVVGLGGGWVAWLATGQSLWLLLPATIGLVSLGLIVSGLADLVLAHTRDRELLRREKARLRRDEADKEIFRAARKNTALMREAGMTDDEIESWANQRMEEASRRFSLYVRYSGLMTRSEDIADAEEEEFIGRGRLASRHRRPPPRR